MNDRRKMVGKKKEFDDLLKKLKEFEREQSHKYNELIKQIESLLPGATSAGLAAEFKRQKDSYSKQIVLNSIFFYAVLIVIFFVASSLIIDISAIAKCIIWDNADKNVCLGLIVQYKSFQSAWTKALPRLIVMTPLIWMAYVISKNRNQAYRLKQEYAHKESVSASIESYSRQIEKLDVGREELMSKLISIAIDAISKNPAETLDKHHGDRPPILDILYDKMKSKSK